MKIWLIVGIVVAIGLVTFFIVNQGGSGITSLSQQNGEVIPEVRGGEVIFNGPNAMFKIDWNRVTETDTHYSFSGALVSSNGGSTWEVFPDEVDLNKVEWKRE